MVDSYLPPVVARLQMNMDDFASKIASAKAMMKDLGGTFNIKTDGLDAAATKVAALSKSLQGLNGTVRVNTDGLGTLSAKTAATAAATTAATGIMINGWRMTGTALHWVIAGGAELAAVTIPAIVALGAGLAVMAPAAQSAAAHMQALNTATSASGQMFNQTIGDVLGLGHALQTAQDAAQPQVYGILGSALIAVKGHMGELTTAGSQVAQMFQTFAARVAVDFGPGGSLGNRTTSLFKNMTADLQGLGQVLGNTGHAFVNFASSMPGLAEFLLKILTDVTGLISRLSGVAGPAITAAMAFEEFNRWGGLAAQVMTRMGLASASLSGGIFSFQRFASVVRGLASVGPSVLMGLALGLEKIGAAGAAGGLTNVAAGLEGVISKIGPLQAVIGVGLAVAVGVLIDKMVTAKSAAQQFGAALQQAVQNVSNVQAFQQIAQNIGQLNVKIQQATVAANNFHAGMGTADRAAVSAGRSVKQFGQDLAQQAQDAQNVAQGAAYLAKAYGTTFVGALALADQASVKLSDGITGTGQAAQIARMQIASVVQGYLAMGQSAGQVGADMTALAIQSGLASSNVGKLNQAWDQFQQNLTGGTSALAGFMTSMTNITSVVASFHNNLGKALSIKDSVNQFAAALKNFGVQGSAAWQNFDQVVGQTAPQLIDWMRTAGAEGALSATQFKQAGLDMVSALVPLAAQSKTAQAELLGLVQQIDPSIQTFGQLTSAIKNSGASTSGLNGIIGTATQKMANMNSVAQTLGNVLNSALVSALQAAQVQASGAGAAMQAYSADLMAGAAGASRAAGDYRTLMGDLEKLGLSAKQAAALIAQVTQNLNAMPTSKTITITTNLVTNSISSGGGPPPGVRAPGHAAGTPAAPAGWSWVGEAGPELVKFRGGETVLPNSVSTGFANGAYSDGPIVVQVHLDGRQITQAVAQRAVQNQRRTGHNGMSKRTR